MSMLLAGMLYTTLLAGSVLLLGALGEVVAERAGVFNLGIEGLLALGGIAGFVVVDHGASPITGLVAGFATGAVFGILFALATVFLGASQTLCGLALTICGTGLANSLGRFYAGHPARAILAPMPIPGLSSIPVLGRGIFTQNAWILIVWILLPVLLHLFLFRTRMGLALRALGEDPSAAATAGIHVLPMRFAAVVFGAGFAGLAGATLSLAYITSWSNGITGGRGWIVIALVIFSGFKPLQAAAGAFLFGAITALGFVGQARDWPIAPAFLSMLPYLGTIALMIIPAMAAKRRRAAAPASLGLPYERELR